jgi:hypothetical protein
MRVGSPHLYYTPCLVVTPHAPLRVSGFVLPRKADAILTRAKRLSDSSGLIDGRVRTKILRN